MNLQLFRAPNHPGSSLIICHSIEYNEVALFYWITQLFIFNLIYDMNCIVIIITAFSKNPDYIPVLFKTVVEYWFKHQNKIGIPVYPNLTEFELFYI